MTMKFKSHMMYDPETGKGYKAETHEDHVRMKEMGYVHEKPEVKETFLTFNKFIKNSK